MRQLQVQGDNFNERDPLNGRWFGHSFDDTKDNGVFRLGFQNLNNIGSTSIAANFKILAANQEAMDIDLLGFSEHGINYNKPQVREKVAQATKGAFAGRSATQLTSGNMERPSNSLPGGTGIMMIGNTVGRIEPQGNGTDRMGRWTYYTLRRRHQTPLTIYSVYMVCQKPTNETGTTSYHQQKLQLTAEGRPNAHPRQAFLADLKASVRQHQSSGHAVILGGDFNCDMSPGSVLANFAATLNLVDPWVHHYPGEEDFRSYRRGSKRIDVMLCTPAIIPMIRHVGYAPFGWMTNSDHRLLVCDISAEHLFGSTDKPLESPNVRVPKSNGSM